MAHSAEEIGDGLEVLFSQDFGRHHNSPLPAGGDNGKQGGQDYYGFAAAYFALEQAAHGRSTPLQVGQDFVKAAALGVGQGKGQGLDDAVEQCGVGGNGNAGNILSVAVAAGQDRKLQGQQFVKGQTAAGLGPLTEVVRVVGLAEGLTQGH